MWEVDNKTKMAAAVCDFDLHVLLVSSIGFHGWGTSKGQTKDIYIVFNSVLDCCSQSLATSRYVADNEAAKIAQAV